MSTVAIENQVDHRTLRTSTNQHASNKSREKRKALKAAGLCTVCGVVAVANRSMCKPCVDRHTVYVERAVFRKHNVPLPDALLLPQDRNPGQN
jgi:hypothetical protein